MNIRIGNDIRLNITLITKGSVDSVNIKSLTAYIINDSILKHAAKDLENKTRFISRYPLEPYIDAYSSTAYDIKSSGYPIYNAFPKNYVHMPYAGFGVNPVWGKIYKNIPDRNLTEYKAQVKATEQKDTVLVFFPAEAQLYTGSYNIVIVAKIYDEGYSNNLRTVTMDYENVFVLVNTSEEGVDSDVTLNVGKGDSSIADEELSSVATSVSVSGTNVVAVGQYGMAHATVYPADLKDKSVSWFVQPKEVFLCDEIKDFISTISLTFVYKNLSASAKQFEKGKQYTLETIVSMLDGDDMNQLESLFLNSEEIKINITKITTGEDLQVTRYYTFTKKYSTKLLHLANVNGNSVYYNAVSIPETAEACTVELCARSNQTVDVVGKMAVTITKGADGTSMPTYFDDIYITGGNSSANKLTLTRSDGVNLDIDTSELIDESWYEGV